MSFGVDLFLRKSLSRLPRLFRIAAALLEVLPPSSLVKGGGTIAGLVVRASIVWPMVQGTARALFALLGVHVLSILCYQSLFCIDSLRTAGVSPLFVAGLALLLFGAFLVTSPTILILFTLGRLYHLDCSDHVSSFGSYYISR